MILKPIAKPVRIRIKSGGMEHSSVESLKSHFVVDDIKDLVADGRLSRWLEQQNHRSIPNEILALNKDSMEFTLVIYRFFFDEKNEMSDGEVYYYLYQETNNDDFLNKSAEEHFPKALIELDERRKKAEDEARRKAEEEARRKAEKEARMKAEEEVRWEKEKYIMVGGGRFVELYEDRGYCAKIPQIRSNIFRLLSIEEWQFLVEHIGTDHPFYKKYIEPISGQLYFMCQSRSSSASNGVCVSDKLRVHFHYSDAYSATLLLFKDVKV